MRIDTPLRSRHDAWVESLRTAPRPAASAHRPGAATGALVAGSLSWLPYGPPGDDGAPRCEIVADYGEVEAEYAALRRGAGILDSPHRGVIRIGGAERRDFLNRMLTQELADLEPGRCRSSFWLNRKGRIEADLLLVETGDAILADVDIHQAASAAQGLAEFLFAEDAVIEDESASRHRLTLHGPAAIAVVAAACGRPEWTIAAGAASIERVNGIECVVARRDLLAEPGLELFMPRDDAGAVWDALLATGRVRPVGWHAFNVARIEAGAATINIDFDSTCLPHETGLLRERVSFTKGCYLGQEIVARMEHLGRPKRTLVGLRIEAPPGAGRDAFVLPVAGSLVHALEAAPQEGAAGAGLLFGEPVGEITSSTISPMLGAQPIAFAMLKSPHAVAGRRLGVADDGVRTSAIVGPLRAWPAPEGAAAEPEAPAR